MDLDRKDRVIDILLDHGIHFRAESDQLAKWSRANDAYGNSHSREGLFVFRHHSPIVGKSLDNRTAEGCFPCKDLPLTVVTVQVVSKSKVIATVNLHMIRMCLDVAIGRSTWDEIFVLFT